MAFNPDAALKEFPCSFNLVPRNQVSRQRLKHVKHNLESDLGSDDRMDEEEVRNKNLLSWVLFSLDKKQDASKLNEEVLKLTQRRNIVSLGNLIFITCRRGWERKAEEEHFKELLALQKEENFEQLRLVALAEQAYSYSRIGGIENSKLSLKLFKECTEKCPENFIWKFGLGLLYRRLNNCNFHCSNPENLNLREAMSKCAHLLMEVGKNGNVRFKGLAYAQLVNLRQSLRGYQYNNLFDNLNIWKLKDKALEFGGDNPTVLTLCGKSFKSLNIDESITLLKRSVELRENGIAYHHLGLSLIKKADLLATGKYRNESVSESRPVPDRGARRQISFDSADHPSLHLHREPIRCEAPHDYSRHAGHTSHAQLPVRAKVRLMGRHCQQRPSVKDRRYDDMYHPGGYYDEFETSTSMTQAVVSPGNFKRHQVNYNQHRHHFKDTRRPASDSLLASKYREVRGGNRGNRRPYVQKSMSVPSSNSPYNVDTLKNYARSPVQKINKNNELVKEAIECYEKSIQVTREQNVPAMLSLGDVYLRSGQDDAALAQYNQVIAHAEDSYILTLLSAHEFAGICLQNLSKHSDKPEKLLEQAKEHFTKAISLAADMVSRNPNFQNCETEVWQSFKIMRNNIESIAECKLKTKETIKLLELVKKYSDIVEVSNKMIDIVWDDIDSFQTLLQSYLKIGDYEDALACLNMASTKSGLTNNELWSSPKVMEIRARTYIGASWSRLIKSGPDCRRVFQQLFQLKYGQCAGMDRGDNDLQIDGRDILVVNDETADDEDGPNATTTLACNLSQVFNVVFGTDTFRNLMVNSDFMHGVEETQLQEMKNYKLVLLILGENDSQQYNQMLEAAHIPNGPKIMGINLRQCKNTPQILQRNRFLNFDDDILNRTKLLCKSSNDRECNGREDVQWSVKDVVCKLLDRNIESAMRLFCFLVEEDFEKHQEDLKPLLEKTDSKTKVLDSAEINEETSSSSVETLKGLANLKIQ